MALKNPDFSVLVGPYNFVQISLACGASTYQIRYGETSDFQYQH